MSKTITTIARSVARDIPLNKLVPSPENVRKTHRDGVVAERAASILAHGLLHSLTARPQVAEDGRETGRYEVTIGGTRLAALKLLASRKQIAKNAPIPCNIREDGNGAELSLAENIERENLHPADEFEAFRELQAKGLGADDIAARFGVTPRIVRERLKLGTVSPELLNVYRKGDMTLEQLMAFTVIDDPVRQEEVWTNLPVNRSADRIRRALLETHIRATDKRAQFVGIEGYEAAGGAVVRDLFSEDGGGYLADAALLDRLAKAKLDGVADTMRAEGWKWVEATVDFPHSHGLKRHYPCEVDLSEIETKRLEQIEAEIDEIGAALEEAVEPDPKAEANIAALNAEYEEIDARGRVFDPEIIARAGVFVSIGHHGQHEIARGFVRREDDEKPVEEVKSHAEPGTTAASTAANSDEEADEGPHLSDRLIADLTAQRAMAMRDALGADTGWALIALTHAMALQTFYHGAFAHSCLRVSASSPSLEYRAPGIGESLAARKIAVRHEVWAAQMPADGADVWAFVLALGSDERSALLAHCVSLTVDACGPQDIPRWTFAHVNTLASALKLEMRDYWAPTANSYLGRVPKALILQSVREAVSEEAANRLTDLKKVDMAEAAEQLLTATTWLPEILRMPAASEQHTLVQETVQAEAAE